jgi:ABC-2 type transport system permease protein
VIWTIAAREWRILFASPLAWTVLAVVQFLMAWFFLGNLEVYIDVQPRLAALAAERGVTDLIVAPTFGTAGIVMLFTLPLLTMRAVSEERRAGTLTLLLAAPVTSVDIAVGKFLGLLGMVAAMALLIGLMPVSLYAGTTLDLGQFLGAWLAFVLLLSAFAAIGLFLSCLTAQPAIAALTTFGVSLLLWVIDLAVAARGGEEAGVLRYLSMLRHYEALLEGAFDTADAAYFVIMIASFVALAAWRLDLDRLER